MTRMLCALLLALLFTACRSEGDTYAAPSLREVTAANQCMDQCQRRHDSCMASRTGFGSSDSCGTGVATQRDTRCDKIDNPDLRKSCQASADYCRNRLPALTCGEDRGRCMSGCGG
ncbi:hypothetical protein [Stenotrophomonas sp.]|uniref:hypothetical protein n=1 Tax=Stenotrophomonas sp. TaxID=69392 RepID=UPI002FC776D6